MDDYESIFKDVQNKKIIKDNLNKCNSGFPELTMIEYQIDIKDEFDRCSNDEFIAVNDSKQIIIEDTKVKEEGVIQTSDSSNEIAKITRSKNVSQKCNFFCTVCQKFFCSISSLNRHKTTHSGEKPYICDYCHKAFRIISFLVEHKRTHEQQYKRNLTNEKRYSCDICDKKFSNQCSCSCSNVLQHKLIHTDQKSHVCDVCERRFRSVCQLKRHRVTHTGDKDYVCDMCGRAFSRSYHLCRHRFRHTDYKPYTCTDCGKSFIRSSQLVVHQARHVDTSQSKNKK